MKIAVNTRFLLKGKLEGIGIYTQEIFKRVVSLMPEHQFYFLFDRNADDADLKDITDQNQIRFISTIRVIRDSIVFFRKAKSLLQHFFPLYTLSDQQFQFL